jgi:putative tricarboxylic transport membrane protein
MKMQEKKKSAKGELVFTSFLFLAGIVVLWDASQIPQSIGANYVSNQAFPTIIGTLLLLLSGIQLVRVMLGDRGVAEEIEGGQIEGKLHLKKFFFVLGGLLFFAVTVKILGFIVSSTVMFTSIVYALNNKKSKWYVVLAIALVMSIVVYVGFNHGLQIKLPWGFNFDFSGDTVIVEEDW